MSLHYLISLKTSSLEMEKQTSIFLLHSVVNWTIFNWSGTYCILPRIYYSMLYDEFAEYTKSL